MTNEDKVKLKKLAARFNKNDAAGNPNLVAKVRATRKGEKLEVSGASVGGEGKDGGRYYDIRLSVKGTLYCSCPASRFSGWGECKHVYKAREVANAGERFAPKMDVVVYDFNALAN